MWLHSDYILYFTLIWVTEINVEFQEGKVLNYWYELTCPDSLENFHALHCTNRASLKINYILYNPSGPNSSNFISWRIMIKGFYQERGKRTPTTVWFWWHHLLNKSSSLKKKAHSLPSHIYKVETIYKTIQLAELKVMSVPKRLCCYRCFIVVSVLLWH